MSSRFSRRDFGRIAAASGVSLTLPGITAQAAGRAISAGVSSSRAFPPDFLWSSATASYQVEGAVNEDGRGVSIWATFSHTPGKTDQGENGDVADDFYHRYTQDIALMKNLGLKTCRFSIAWSRIFPNGTGAVNPKALDFYDRLTDALLEACIASHCTLYHWDPPQALQD